MSDPKAVFQLFYAELCEMGVPEPRAADMAFSRMREHFAHLADHAKQQSKDNGKWPPKT